jgi:hypothetical protein
MVSNGVAGRLSAGTTVSGAVWSTVRYRGRQAAGTVATAEANSAAAKVTVSAPYGRLRCDIPNYAHTHVWLH